MSKETLNLENEIVGEEPTLPSAPKVTSGVAQFHLFSSRRNRLEVNFKKKTAELVKTKDDLLASPLQLDEKSIAYYQHTLPLIIGNAKGFKLPLGLTIVSGGTAAGKSTLLRALVDVKRFLCVEVPDTTEELKSMKLYDSDSAALAAAILEAGNEGTLCAIDSLRSTLFEADGAAGPKGIIMEFFTNITRVSNSLAANGLSMIATVNPMHDDAEYVTTFLSKLSSAVPCFISLSAATADGRASGTVATRDCRGGASFTLEPGAKVTKEEVTFIGHRDLVAEEVQSLISPVQVAQLDKHNY